MNKARILIVDDARTTREALQRLFERHPDIEVVGEAPNGEEAVRQTRRLQPDLITMDIEMPVMDGLEATRQIMRERPTPIVIISSAIHRGEVELSFQALQAGAIDVFEKPRLADLGKPEGSTQRLLRSIRTILHLHPRTEPGAEPPPEPAVAPVDAPPSMIVIGASTGGPQALDALVRMLPAGFPIPIAVVQHMTEGFLPGMAASLSKRGGIAVRIAHNGMPLQPGMTLAPDANHLIVTPQKNFGLLPRRPGDKHCPSVDCLMHSAAEVYGAAATGVILTGMGNDGCEGIKHLFRCGAMTVAQDEASSVIFGMPKEAIDSGAVHKILSLPSIGAFLMQGTEQAQRAS